ncbi:hypothetical protein MELA_01246 [Candidatus Methylomirabilis lanthanidiphila]|uniref:Uncharacterized protein n=1 Tax=Candidatus Methylomirabilis lanthanidiphila TaxID=2211376 RepID=A0A564ZHR6_9BACT|nr:hypothetical protein MELA_01246 [Candidatus Methylomirabilis lanthanidiphila]
MWKPSPSRSRLFMGRKGLAIVNGVTDAVDSPLYDFAQP